MANKYRQYYQWLGRKVLDSSNHMYIINFTVRPSYPGDSDVDRKTERGKAPNPAPARHAQPAPAGGDPRTVPGERLLRSQRPGAGQVRDVASGAKRESAHQPVSEGFWFIAPFVLSSPVSLGAIRIGRAGTTEARAERGPQTDGSGNGVSVVPALPIRIAPRLTGLDRTK